MCSDQALRRPPDRTLCDPCVRTAAKAKIMSGRLVFPLLISTGECCEPPSRRFD
jgi:hypothetical protein